VIEYLLLNTDCDGTHRRVHHHPHSREFFVCVTFATSLVLLIASIYTMSRSYGDTIINWRWRYPISIGVVQINRSGLCAFDVWVSGWT